MSCINKSYIEEFNILSKIYLKNPSYSNTTSLSENLSCLCGTSNFKQFETGTLNTSNFYNNLRILLDNVDIKSSIFLLCISTLKHASRHLSARKSIIYDHRFLPVLSSCLTKLRTKDQDSSILLELIQDLTYGFKITCQEPYLADLLNYMVNVILSDQDNLKPVCLSILINLCYRNITSSYLLMRSINFTEFMSRIKDCGIYTVKLLIILENQDRVFSKKDFHYFVKLSLMDIEKSLRNWDVPHLRQIVDFITDYKNIDDLNSSISDEFVKSIEILVNNVDGRISMNDESITDDDDTGIKQQLCLSMIFELLDCILNVDKEVKILYPSIINLLYKCFDNEHTRGKAYNVLISILCNDCTGINIEEILKPILKTFGNVFLQTNLTLNDELLSFLKLLNELIINSYTKCSILNLINVNFFNNIFSNLLHKNPSVNTNLSTTEIHIYVMAMVILIKLTAESPKIWYSQISDLYKEKEIQFMLAKALSSGESELCSVVLTFAKSDIFPHEKISKFMAKHDDYIPINSSPSVIYEKPIMNSKYLEERMDDIISNINKEMANNNFNDIRTTQIIELYQHKIDILKNNENSLLCRLNQSSDHITHLTKRSDSLNSENARYEQILFIAKIAEEKLKKENRMLEQSIDSLKISLKNLYKHIETEKSSKINFTKSLEIKQLEIDQLNINVEKLKNSITASDTRNDELRKSLKCYEDEIKKNKIVRGELENESKLTKIKLNEGEKEVSKLRDCVKSLEKQLAIKDEKIVSYENELSETEQMRETILSLMQNKKSKKK